MRENLKEKVLTILIVILAAQCFVFAQSNSWNGLTPLRSTRADVEKLFGAAKECLSGCTYRGEKVGLEVFYAERECDGGWNVPKDTVIRFDLYSFDEGKSFDELKLDRNKFSYTVDDAMFGTWTNPEDGLSYYFGNFDRFLRSIGYIPKKSDNLNLRCNGFPPYAPEGRHYTMEYTDFYDPDRNKRDNFFNNIARFQNFFVNFGNVERDFKDEKYKSYAVIYFDQKMPYREYQSFLRRIKKFVSETWKTQYEKLTIIEGGLREQSRIEFYILRAEQKPPAPEPTLPSPQFMRKRQ